MFLVAHRRLKGLVFLLVLILLTSACGGEVSPLALNVISTPSSLDEVITITLDNPDNCSLFIPVDWAGIEIFRIGTHGNWIEYMNHRKSVPMFSTSAGELIYSIPAGTFAPGMYKLVVRGRAGQEGASFTVEVNLDLSQFASSDIKDY
jgi:hypothetical protein